MLQENEPPIYSDLQPLPRDKPSKVTRFVNKIIILALVLITVCLGILLSWGLEDENLYKFNKDPLPVRTIRAHPTEGGVVFLQRDFCKATDTVTTERISYVNEGRELFIPLTKEDTKNGCHKEETLEPIPACITPGTYRIKVRFTYDKNPLKRGIVQEFFSEPIIIDPSRPDNQLPQGAVES
jgi:hypothetical protein